MYAVELASCCAVAVAWLVFQPQPAHRRLNVLRGRRPTANRGLAGRLIRSLLHRLASHREQKRRRQRRRAAVIELCDGMASELVAGRTPDEAFAITADLLHPSIAAELTNVPPFAISTPPLNRPLHGEEDEPNTPGIASNPTSTAGPTPSGRSSAALNGPLSDTPASQRPTPERLEDLARRPGAEGLRLLAACWRIGAERGGTLATVLDDLAAALRDQESNRQEVATQLAGPRATARLLAGLPLLGLVMAAMLGADPLAFLFGTLPGLACLLVGVGLNATGVWWTHRLARSAEELL